MALEEVLDGVLVKEVVLLVDAELFKSFRYLAQEDLLRKYLHYYICYFRSPGIQVQHYYPQSFPQALSQLLDSHVGAALGSRY